MLHAANYTHTTEDSIDSSINTGQKTEHISVDRDRQPTLSVCTCVHVHASCEGSVRLGQNSQDLLQLQLQDPLSIVESGSRDPTE